MHARKEEWVQVRKQVELWSGSRGRALGIFWVLNRISESYWAQSGLEEKKGWCLGLAWLSWAKQSKGIKERERKDIGSVMGWIDIKKIKGEKENKRMKKKTRKEKMKNEN